jgi:hypothetical protein
MFAFQGRSGLAEATPDGAVKPQLRGRPATVLHARRHGEKGQTDDSGFPAHTRLHFVKHRRQAVSSVGKVARRDVTFLTERPNIPASRRRMVRVPLATSAPTMEGRMTAAVPAYRFGDFTLHPAERQLLKGGEEVVLRPKAFDTLLCLVRHHGHAAWRERLPRPTTPAIAPIADSGERRGPA